MVDFIIFHEIIQWIAILVIFFMLSFYKNLYDENDWPKT